MSEKGVKNGIWRKKKGLRMCFFKKVERVKKEIESRRGCWLKSWEKKEVGEKKSGKGLWKRRRVERGREGLREEEKDWERKRRKKEEKKKKKKEKREEKKREKKEKKKRRKERARREGEWKLKEGV